MRFLQPLQKSMVGVVLHSLVVLEYPSKQGNWFVHRTVLGCSRIQTLPGNYHEMMETTDLSLFGLLLMLNIESTVL